MHENPVLAFLRRLNDTRSELEPGPPSATKRNFAPFSPPPPFLPPSLPSARQYPNENEISPGSSRDGLEGDADPSRGMKDYQSTKLFIFHWLILASFILTSWLGDN